MEIDTLIRTKRKTLSVTILENGQIVVKAPITMNLEKVSTFLKAKESWIVKKQNEILAKNKINRDFFEYKKLIFCGKVLNIAYSVNAKKPYIENSTIYFKPAISLVKSVRMQEKFLRLQCEQIVRERITYFSNLMQLDAEKIKYINAKQRWGTCSSKSIIGLNWRMVMLPPQLIDYVVVHELTHILEFNHSQSFWELVGAVLPDYKQRRLQLKECNFILRLYRDLNTNNTLI